MADAPLEIFDAAGCVGVGFDPFWGVVAAAFFEDDFEEADHALRVESGGGHEVVTDVIGFGFVSAGVAEAEDSISDTGEIPDDIGGIHDTEEDGEAELPLHVVGVLAGPVLIEDVDDFVGKDACDLILGGHFVEESAVEEDGAAREGEGVEFLAFDDVEGELEGFAAESVGGDGAHDTLGDAADFDHAGIGGGEDAFFFSDLGGGFTAKFDLVIHAGAERIGGCDSGSEGRSCDEGGKRSIHIGFDDRGHGVGSR